MKIADKIERVKKDSSGSREADSFARKIDAEYETCFDAASGAFQAQVPFTKVVSHCGCGCPSVGLEMSRDTSVGHAAGNIIVDLQGMTPDGNAVGVLVFVDGGYLSDLEIYDYEDIPRPFPLPTLESLHGFDESPAA